jgi:hypothetical protein
MNSKLWLRRDYANTAKNAKLERVAREVDHHLKILLTKAPSRGHGLCNSHAVIYDTMALAIHQIGARLVNVANST